MVFPSKPTTRVEVPTQLSLEKSEDTAAPREHESTEGTVNLPACNSVTFQVKDNLPGVSYVDEDKEQWTLVKRRRRKKRCDHEAVSDSGSEIDVAVARQVCYAYDERRGIPGLYVRHGCTLHSVSLTPIDCTHIILN